MDIVITMIILVGAAVIFLSNVSGQAILRLALIHVRPQIEPRAAVMVLVD